MQAGAVARRRGRCGERHLLAGVLLYELLTGGRPYRLKAGASAAQLEQAIVSARVERPSVQLARQAALEGPRRIKSQRDGCSGTWTRSCSSASMAPKHRYASASALADDLQRHLNGGAVQARAHRVIPHAGKLLARHHSGAAAAAALVVAAAVGLALARAPTAVPAYATQHGSRQRQAIALLPFVEQGRSAWPA